MVERARLAFDGTTAPHANLLLETLARHRIAALEEAAHKATSFLVGDPANGVPLRNPMAHEIAAAIRALIGEDHSID